MEINKNQALYRALPGCWTTYSDSEKSDYKYACQVLNWNTKQVNDINEKMLFDYKVISYKPKLVLSYCDESILKKLNDFTFTDIEEGRKRYLEILRQYGLYSDIEKIECFGIPLASVTIYTNINNLNKIKYDSKIVKKS